jgi:hypothetical protein
LLVVCSNMWSSIVSLFKKKYPTKEGRVYPAYLDNRSAHQVTYEGGVSTECSLEELLSFFQDVQINVATAAPLMVDLADPTAFVEYSYFKEPPYAIGRKSSLVAVLLISLVGVQADVSASMVATYSEWRVLRAIKDVSLFVNSVRSSFSAGYDSRSSYLPLDGGLALQVLVH